MVKLPQEWWLHVARLDLTEEIAAHPGIAALLAGLAVVFQRRVRPRLPPADRPWRTRPDPLPEQIGEAHEQSAWRIRHDAVRSWNTFEKALLLGLITTRHDRWRPVLGHRTGAGSARAADRSAARR